MRTAGIVHLFKEVVVAVVTAVTHAQFIRLIASAGAFI